MFGHLLVRQASVNISYMFWNYFFPVNRLQFIRCIQIYIDQLVYHKEKTPLRSEIELISFSQMPVFDDKRRVGIARKPYFKICVLQLYIRIYKPTQRERVESVIQKCQVCKNIVNSKALHKEVFLFPLFFNFSFPGFGGHFITGTVNILCTVFNLCPCYSLFIHHNSFQYNQTMGVKTL